MRVNRPSKHGRTARHSVLMSIRARFRRAEVPDLSQLPDPLILDDTNDQALEDERHAALAYLDEAWNEAVYDGLDEDCLAQAALFATAYGAKVS